MSDTYIHLRSARKKAGLTQGTIAQACGVSRNAVTQWESLNPSTRTEPSISNLIIISKLTNMPISGLVGLEPKEPNVSYSLGHVKSQKIPVMTWQQAQNLSIISDIKRIKPIAQQVNLIAVADVKKIFALLISDSSMTAPVGIIPSFPEGYLIHIDLEQDIAILDYVIVRIEGQQQLTFKQLKLGAGKKYLHSLDPSLPNIFDKFELIGKVVAASIVL